MADVEHPTLAELVRGRGEDVAERASLAAILRDPAG
ncbi:MAG: hypothetical protein KatS3mg117_2896 [Geminicoccaceae bacterium]|jgi:hypothetical protein|nr:MAG: hypothetical protein KatS3mg117_2896 [Geminicoccaceae bacterium]